MTGKYSGDVRRDSILRWIAEGAGSIPHSKSNIVEIGNIHVYEFVPRLTDDPHNDWHSADALGNVRYYIIDDLCPGQAQRIYPDDQDVFIVPDKDWGECVPACWTVLVDEKEEKAWLFYRGRCTLEREKI